MCGVTDEQRNLSVRWWIESENVGPDVFLSLGLLPPLNAVRLQIGVAGNLCLEFYEVLLRPEELEPPGVRGVEPLGWSGHDLPLEGDARRTKGRGNRRNPAGSPRTDPNAATSSAT